MQLSLNLVVFNQTHDMINARGYASLSALHTVAVLVSPMMWKGLTQGLTPVQQMVRSPTLPV